MLRNIRFGAYKKRRICEMLHYGNVYESSRRSISTSKQNRVPRQHSSLYKLLRKFIIKAREMESAARDIRKKFQEIATSGLLISSSWLLRKEIISVKRGKVMFSMDQLVQVVDVIMGNLPHILFCPKSETKEYVIFSILVYQHGRCCM